MLCRGFAAGRCRSDSRRCRSRVWRCRPTRPDRAGVPPRPPRPADRESGDAGKRRALLAAGRRRPRSGGSPACRSPTPPRHLRARVRNRVLPRLCRSFPSASGPQGRGLCLRRSDTRHCHAGATSPGARRGTRSPVAVGAGSSSRGQASGNRTPPARVASDILQAEAKALP